MYKKLFLSFVFTTLMLCQPVVAKTPTPQINARTLAIMVTIFNASDSTNDDAKGILNQNTGGVREQFFKNYGTYDTVNSEGVTLDELKVVRQVLMNLVDATPEVKQAVRTILLAANGENEINANFRRALNVTKRVIGNGDTNAEDLINQSRDKNAPSSTSLYDRANSLNDMTNSIIANLINDSVVDSNVSGLFTETICYDSASMVMLCP